MVSPLENKIAKAIHRGFKGKLLKGVLARIGDPTSLDEHGDPVGGTAAVYNFEGFVESFSAFFQATSGIPSTDLKVLIIARSLKTVPEGDDIVNIKGKILQVRKILEVDPAEATYILQCFELKHGN